MCKIVAIGGGSIGRGKDGIKRSYETLLIDKEIINLTNKKSPKLLFLGHGSEASESYFNVIKDNFTKLGCTCRHLKTKTLKNMNVVKEMLDEADIIYVGGGSTKKLMDTWTSSGLDKLLIDAYNGDKVMCGISAGAMCWFKYGCSDSLRVETKDETAPLIGISGLNIVNALFVPHAGLVEGQVEYVKDILKDKDLVALSLTNGCAIEILSNKYKLLYSLDNASMSKSYWLNNKFYSKKVDCNSFKDISKLLERE